MSITTLIGFLVSVGLFIGVVLDGTNNPVIFFSLSGLLIVVGGTLAATFVGFEARYVGSAIVGLASIFSPQRFGRDFMNHEVGRVVRWAYLAQQRGMVALEQESKKVEADPFLKFSLELLLSGYSAAEIKSNLIAMAETGFSRNLIGASILKAMGAAAPAFGMIGTLIGLIIMLDTLGDDPTQIGPGLAIALTTTLYAVLLARMFFLPAASKMTQREQIRKFRYLLITEGVIMLAERKSPRNIQDRMNSFLDPSIRFDIEKQLRGDRTGATEKKAKAG